MSWYWWALIGVAIAVAFFFVGSSMKESAINKEFTLVKKGDTKNPPADPASTVN